MNHDNKLVTAPSLIHTANVFLPGCLGPVKRDVVLADDHHELIAGLLAENETIKNQFDECARLFVDATEQACKAQRELDQLKAEINALRALLDTPHTADWFEGVKLEAGHQIKRWGTEHDAGKTPADWFWLIGYLAQKAMTAQMAGNEEKARHHTISTGAAMLNWFRAIVGDNTAMRPGIEAPANDDVPHFTPGNGNKARRRAAAVGIDMDASLKAGGIIAAPPLKPWREIAEPVADADRKCHEPDCWNCEGTGRDPAGGICRLNGGIPF